jgi:hypothetical protein
VLCSDGRVYVRGLRHITVRTLASALEIMKEGAASKKVAETQMNADSSRSHTVFTVSLYLAKTALGGGAGAADAVPHEPVNAATGGTAAGLRLWSRLSIVDLAGSERQSRTMNTGTRLREAGRINTSLMVLMNCFEVMRHNAQHPTAARLVPFRETKLTRMFADSLGGLSTGTTIMILNAGACGWRWRCMMWMVLVARVWVDLSGRGGTSGLTHACTPTCCLTLHCNHRRTRARGL